MNNILQTLPKPTSPVVPFCSFGFFASTVRSICVMAASVLSSQPCMSACWSTWLQSTPCRILYSSLLIFDVRLTKRAIRRVIADSRLPAKVSSILSDSQWSPRATSWTERWSVGNVNFTLWAYVCTNAYKVNSTVY